MSIFFLLSPLLAYVVTHEAVSSGVLDPPTGRCQVEKLPERKDAHWKPLLPSLPGI